MQTHRRLNQKWILRYTLMNEWMIGHKSINEWEKGTNSVLYSRCVTRGTWMLRLFLFLMNLMFPCLDTFIAQYYSIVLCSISLRKKSDYTLIVIVKMIIHLFNGLNKKIVIIINSCVIWSIYMYDFVSHYFLINTFIYF
jgi:hypothetical protein